jgi:beta-galactosidase
MNKSTFFLIVLLFQAGVVCAQSNASERLSLDNSWRFHLGEIAAPKLTKHDETYGNAKAGNAQGAASTRFDDSKWRLLNLPHDWAVEQPFDSTENLSQGYRKRGIGWYRRHFKLNNSDRGKYLELQFDGIATHCTVWVNGTVVHRNWSGYTSFYIDITALAKYGDELNTIAVRVDANDMEGWWYEGAGIYRHTWLMKKSAVHITTDGVYANPVRLNGIDWFIPVEATVSNESKTDAEIEVEATLYDAAGKQIVQSKVGDVVKPLDHVTAKISLPTSTPQLWWVDQPTLYSVKTVVRQNGKQVDETITQCGFRTIRFTADSGFYLNDTYMKLKGTCNHQDHAGVGVAIPDALWEFRIRKLKEMGSNAYRCSHNPPAKEFLDLCDKMGLLVMDENRNFNASPEYVRQLQWMVQRDRNHPSVILWSVFNEEPMQGSENGYEMVRRMRAEVRKLDTTRPVTAAMNGGLFASKNVSQAVDVVGFNYQISSYDRFHEANPTLPLTSSEDVSGLMQRDVYVTNKSKHLVDAYDSQKPSWGATHRVAWKAVAERRYLAGCFVWTGFDYRGEPTPYNWPTAGSNFGIMDLCGFPKTAFYIHQAQWVSDRNILHVVPHWNWPADSIGKPIKVMAISNAETVQLLLNGKSLGEQNVDPYEMNSFMVNYQPGRLEAVGYKKGKEVSRYKIETTGEPVSIQLIADRAAMNGDGWDAMPTTVKVLDAKGRAVPTANLPIDFELAGPGKIIGLGNGDPTSHEAEKGNRRSLYNGLAEVILQTDTSASQPLVLTAIANGLKPAKLTINVNQKEAIPSVAYVHPPLTLEGWRVSPVTQSKPDPNEEIASNDMNSWAPLRAGQLQALNNGNFIVFRTTFTPYVEQQKAGGVLSLRRVTGKAEVYIDRKLVSTKSDATAADMKINIPPANGERVISVLIEGEQGQRVGLGGVVTLQ